MRRRYQTDHLALAVVIALILFSLAFTAVALAYEPLRDFLIFWFYVLALLIS